MNRTEAWKLDTEFYTEPDGGSGLLCVFGNNSGFAYKNSLDSEQAKKYVDELKKNKELEITYS